MHVQTQHTWLVVPDTDSRVTCSKTMSFCKLHACNCKASPLTFLQLGVYDNVRYHTKVARYILYCNYTWKCEVYIIP